MVSRYPFNTSSVQDDLEEDSDEREDIIAETDDDEEPSAPAVNIFPATTAPPASPSGLAAPALESPQLGEDAPVHDAERMESPYTEAYEEIARLGLDPTKGKELIHALVRGTIDSDLLYEAYTNENGEIDDIIERADQILSLIHI